MKKAVSEANSLTTTDPSTRNGEDKMYHKTVTLSSLNCNEEPIFIACDRYSFGMSIIREFRGTLLTLL